MKLDDFLAKCPRCGTKLSLDQMGCDRCPKCFEEFMESGDYEASADLSIRIMDEVDTKYLLIPSKKLEELIAIIESIESSERKTEDEI